MADKSVGSAGTLRITDNGSAVTFTVLCSDGETHCDYQWRVYVNGAWTGWTTTRLNAGFGSKVLTSKTVSTSQTVRMEQRATSTQGLGGATTHSMSVSRPKPVKPSRPTLSRGGSDASMSVSWSQSGTNTSSVLERRDDGAVAASTTISGNGRSYTSTAGKANSKYEWRVAGKNAAGQGAWSDWSLPLYTTPAVPTGVKGTRSGNNIIVSASGLPKHATRFDIRDGATTVATDVALPWTHVSPNPAVTHQYTVRARIASGGSSSTTLYSAYSAASAVVQLQAPPAAPGSLAPNGTVTASDAPTTFSWANVSVDSSPQEAYELRYRLTGGAWTTLAGTTDDTRTLSLGEGDWEWQVRTKGSHPDFGPWSPIAAFSVIDRPGVAIISPEDEWDSSTLTIGWVWSQEQGYPQSGWQAYLDRVDGEGLVQPISGSGAATSTAFRGRVVEGEYTLHVRAATGGIWSEWAEATFTVAFDPPAAPVIDGAWDEVEGAVNLSVAPVDDLVPTVQVVVERSSDYSPPMVIEHPEEGHFESGQVWVVDTPEQTINHPAQTVYSNDGTGVTGWTLDYDSEGGPSPSGPGQASITSSSSTSGSPTNPPVIFLQQSGGVQQDPMGTITATRQIPTVPGLTYKATGTMFPTRWEYVSRVELGDQSSGVGTAAGYTSFDVTTVADGDSLSLTLIGEDNPSLGSNSSYINIGVFFDDITVTAEAWTETIPEVGHWEDGDGTWVVDVPAWTETRDEIPGTWEPVAALTEESTVQDRESPSYGDIWYRATAVTAEGASASTLLLVEARSGAVWLSGGDGLGISCRLPLSPKVQISAGRERALQHYAGRSLPVELIGEALSRVVSVSGETFDGDEYADETAHVERLRQVAQADGRFLFRDPDGRRIYGSIPSIDMDRQTSTGSTDDWTGVWGYAFTLTETMQR